MHPKFTFWNIIVLAMLAVTFQPKQAQAVVVDLELVLTVDVSSSVTPSEFLLQKQGYVDAFNNAAIYNAIQQGSNGAIAVSLVYWSTGQVQAIGWTIINSQATSLAFASAIDAATRPANDSPPIGVGTLTGVGDAISFSYPLFTNNGYEGTRLVIDVSGDGPRNTGGVTSTARTNALNAGVTTINGLTIGNVNDPDPNEAQTAQDTIDHYLAQVIGGQNAFHIHVDDFNSFGQGVAEKLQREIGFPNGNGPVIPEPTTVMLLGAGLAGTVFLRKTMKI